MLGVMLQVRLFSSAGNQLWRGMDGSRNLLRDSHRQLCHQQPHGALSTDPAGHPARQEGVNELHGPVSTSELAAGSKPLKYLEVGCSQTKE